MDMTHSTAMLIGRIHDLTHKWLTDELAAAGLPGVAPSHGDVLALLFLKGEATMQELAAFAHRTKPTTTVLVDKLEQMGLVSRAKSKDDARSTIITLTDKGEALRPTFESISHCLIHFVHSDLTEQETETLEILLEKMLSGMGNSTNKRSAT